MPCFTDERTWTCMKVSAPLWMHVSIAGETSLWFLLLAIRKLELKLSEYSCKRRGEGVGVYDPRSQVLKTKTSLVVEKHRTVWVGWDLSRSLCPSLPAVTREVFRSGCYRQNTLSSHCTCGRKPVEKFMKHEWRIRGSVLHQWNISWVSNLTLSLEIGYELCNTVLRPCRAKASLQAHFLMSYSLRIIHKSLL